MPHDPRYSKTTPAPPWGQPPNDPTISSTHTVRIAQPRSQPSETPMDTDPSTTPTTADSGHADTPVDADKWPNRYVELQEDRYTAWDRVRELQETCRVLTELAQQLTNALARTADADLGFHAVTKALDAAAELGITPKDQP